VLDISIINLYQTTLPLFLLAM